MIRRILDALAWRWWYLRIPIWKGIVSRSMHFPRVFSSLRDVLSYSRAMASIDSNVIQTISPRQLGVHGLLCRSGTSDPWVMWDVFFNQFQALPPEIERATWIVDLGANVGYTSAYYASAFPETQILAVEMDTANYALACRNLGVFGNRCRIVNAAVWDRDDQISYCGEETQGYRAVPLANNERSVNVKSICSRSLSSLFDEFGIEQIDFVKMDIEGAEAVVLRGPKEWLHRVKSLKIELHSPMTYEECERVLAGEGFQCRSDGKHDHCLIAIRS
jgi:FkbM family methyltransferase